VKGNLCNLKKTLLLGVSGAGSSIVEKRICSAAKKLVEAYNASKILLLDKSIENKQESEVEKYCLSCII